MAYALDDNLGEKIFDLHLTDTIGKLYTAFPGQDLYQKSQFASPTRAFPHTYLHSNRSLSLIKAQLKTKRTMANNFLKK